MWDDNSKTTMIIIEISCIKCLHHFAKIFFQGNRHLLVTYVGSRLSLSQIRLLQEGVVSRNLVWLRIWSLTPLIWLSRFELWLCCICLKESGPKVKQSVTRARTLKTGTFMNVGCRLASCCFPWKSIFFLSNMLKHKVLYNQHKSHYICKRIQVHCQSHSCSSLFPD